jgi:hypothetical protein
MYPVQTSAGISAIIFFVVLLSLSRKSLNTTFEKAMTASFSCHRKKSSSRHRCYIASIVDTGYLNKNESRLPLQDLE